MPEGRICRVRVVDLMWRFVGRNVTGPLSLYGGPAKDPVVAGSLALLDNHSRLSVRIASRRRGPVRVFRSAILRLDRPPGQPLRMGGSLILLQENRPRQRRCGAMPQNLSRARGNGRMVRGRRIGRVAQDILMPLFVGLPIDRISFLQKGGAGFFAEMDLGGVQDRYVNFFSRQYRLENPEIRFDNFAERSIENHEKDERNMEQNRSSRHQIEGSFFFSGSDPFCFDIFRRMHRSLFRVRKSELFICGKILGLFHLASSSGAGRNRPLRGKKIGVKGSRKSIKRVGLQGHRLKPGSRAPGGPIRKSDVDHKILPLNFSISLPEDGFLFPSGSNSRANPWPVFSGRSSCIR